MWLMLALGFSSGLPLLLTLGTLQAWMSDAGVDLTTIAVFAWLRAPYAYKFLWAPVFDRFALPFLGRRRGWAIVCQLGLVASIVAMSAVDPKQAPLVLAALAFTLNFMSASQDVVLDAYRRDLLPEAELGLGTSIFVGGYRVGMLVASTVALNLADAWPWSAVYRVMASAMLVGMVAILVAPEPADVTSAETSTSRSLMDTYRESFAEFFGRHGLRSALTILSFVLLYKLGDQMATGMSTVFYKELGFSNAQIGNVAKLVGMWAAILGGVAGGAIILRVGINRALWGFGIFQLLTILGFVGLAWAGPDIRALVAVVAAEYLFVGMGTSAFVAFIARSTSPQYSATQLALLTSFMQLPSTLLTGLSGYLVEALNWSGFFLLSTVLAIPGMVLLVWVAPWRRRDDAPVP